VCASEAAGGYRVAFERVRRNCRPRRDFRLGAKGVYIERVFSLLRPWLEALSPAAVTIVVSNAPVARALWGTLIGGAAGSLFGMWGHRTVSRRRGTGLAIATVVTAWALSRWGWPVALALLANWFSWARGLRARALAVAAWASLGWMTLAHHPPVQGWRGVSSWPGALGPGRWGVIVLAGVGLLANLVVGVSVLSRRRRMRQPSVISVIILLFLSLPGMALADEAEPQPGDVIFYEGFEDGFQGFDQRVAAGWQTWSVGSHTPEYKQANPDVGALTARPFPDRVHSGYNAQQYFTVYRVHDAGLYRQISAPPYAVVEVSAWAETWTSNEDDPGHSDSAQNANVRIGADPSGGIFADAPTTAWGATINPLSTWQTAPSVRVQVGEAGMLTIFLRSSPMYPLKHNDIYWDDVQVKLIEVGRAPAAPAPAGGAGLAAAAPVDPILDGLGAVADGVGQKAASTGGWDSLFPSFAVSAVVVGSYLRRRRR